MAGVGDHHHRCPVTQQVDDAPGVGRQSDDVIGGLQHEYVGRSGRPPDLDVVVGHGTALVVGHHRVPSAGPHRGVVARSEERGAHCCEVLLR